MKNNRIFLLIILLLICCYSCNLRSSSKHSERLPLDTVAQLIADCYFLEGEISVKPWEYDIKDYSLKKYEDFFEQHGITKEVFVENIKYYVTHQKYAEKLTEKVDNIVEQRATEYREFIQ
jgi:hypothetical protein